MNTTSFYRIAVASTVSALMLAFAASAVPAQASSAIDAQDWAVFVDPPTRFAFVKTPNDWVFVRQLDEEQMTHLPAGTLFALLKEDDSEIRYAHPALEPSPPRNGNLLFVPAALVPPITSASHATWAEPGATASVPSAASTARAGVSAYLALWSTDARADEATPFSKDLVLSYSHSIPELRAEVRGRTSAITQVRAVAHLGRRWEFRDVRLFPTLNENVYFAQYTAAGVSTFDGASIEQNVVLCLEVDGSQVVRVVEFANPAIVLANRSR
jgi:hypothetical protein